MSSLRSRDQRLPEEHHRFLEARSRIVAVSCHPHWNLAGKARWPKSAVWCWQVTFKDQSDHPVYLAGWSRLMGRGERNKTTAQSLRGPATRRDIWMRRTSVPICGLAQRVVSSRVRFHLASTPNHDTSGWQFVLSSKSRLQRSRLDPC